MFRSDNHRNISLSDTYKNGLVGRFIYSVIFPASIDSLLLIGIPV